MRWYYRSLPTLYQQYISGLILSNVIKIATTNSPRKMGWQNGHINVFYFNNLIKDF
jgi:hypothetical protein